MRGKSELPRAGREMRRAKSTLFGELLTMLITNNRAIMGRWVNQRSTNVLGWVTTAATFAAAIGVVYAWLRG
jgi:Mn2+/Fe2+ NRAMP family transporter